MNQPQALTPEQVNVAMDTLRRFSAVRFDKPQNVYILSDISRSGLGYHCRLFVPAIIGGEAGIMELTYPLAKATGQAYRERGGSLWLYFKGTYNPRMAAELLAQALGIRAEDRARAFAGNPL